MQIFRKFILKKSATLSKKFPQLFLIYFRNFSILEIHIVAAAFIKLNDRKRLRAKVFSCACCLSGRTVSVLWRATGVREGTAFRLCLFKGCLT